jgi:hypothetical protein
MLRNEAIWLGREIGKISATKIGNVLDLGSGSLFFRKLRQPWINKCIFDPLEARGINVIHSDFELDVISAGFTKRAEKLGSFKSVFAFNLLEHVADYKKAAKNIISVIPRDGYLFVSCPKVFPYHPSPIDNGFRPTPIELANLFPKAKIIKKVVINQKIKMMFTRKGILFGKKYSASCLILKTTN